MATVAAPVNNIYKKVIFKSCAPFINCMSRINNTQVDDAQDIDILIPMYNSVEYSDTVAQKMLKYWFH